MLREWLVPGFLNESMAYWQINATTMGADREQLTISAILMGMYPSGTAALTSEGKVSTPDAIQVSATQFLPNTMQGGGELLDGYYLCPRYTHLMNRLANSEIWRTYMAKKQQFVTELEAVSGVNQPHTRTPEGALDTTSRMKWWKEPLTAPAIFNIDETWSSESAQGLSLSGNPTDAMVKEAQEVTDWYMTQKFSHADMAKLACGSLLDDMHASMNLAVSTWNVPENVAHPQTFTSYSKFKAYVASEMTEVCLLSLLSANDGKEPPYGSVVWMTLYNHTGNYSFCEAAFDYVNDMPCPANKHSTTPCWTEFDSAYKAQVCDNKTHTHNYEVQLWYGAVYESKQLPLTGTGFGCTEPCTLKTFGNAIEPLQLPSFTESCGIPSTPPGPPGPSGAAGAPGANGAAVTVITPSTSATSNLQDNVWFWYALAVTIIAVALGVYAFMLNGQLKMAMPRTGEQVPLQPVGSYSGTATP